MIARDELAGGDFLCRTAPTRRLKPIQSEMTRGFIGLHGLPAHTIHAGMLFVTTACAPITAPSPMFTPGPMNAPAAIQHSAPTVIGAQLSGIWRCR
jgi:hypothetical protein